MVDVNPASQIFVQSYTPPVAAQVVAPPPATDSVATNANVNLPSALPSVSPVDTSASSTYTALANESASTIRGVTINTSA